jgi:flagellar motility protein MotE (MotC chaperone)
MSRLLRSPFFAMAAGGICFLLTMFIFASRAITAKAAVRQEVAESTPSFWQQQSPEADQMLQEIKKQKAVLDKRANDLKELAARLEAERAELTTITQRVAQMQMEFDQNVIRLKEAETPNLKKLARMYAGMSPDGASIIFRELDDQVVVKVLSFMKEAESAPLLEAMAKEGDTQAKRAASISEALRKTFAEKRSKP